MRNNLFWKHILDLHQSIGSLNDVRKYNIFAARLIYQRFFLRKQIHIFRVIVCIYCKQNLDHLLDIFLCIICIQMEHSFIEIISEKLVYSHHHRLFLITLISFIRTILRLCVFHSQNKVFVIAISILSSWYHL